MKYTTFFLLLFISCIFDSESKSEPTPWVGKWKGQFQQGEMQLQMIAEYKADWTFYANIDFLDNDWITGWSFSGAWAPLGDNRLQLTYTQCMQLSEETRTLQIIPCDPAIDTLNVNITGNIWIMSGPNGETINYTRVIE